MIERDPKYYVTGYKGDDPYQAPFYLRSLIFDGEGGDYNTRLIDLFNSLLGEKDLFREFCLEKEPSLNKLPKKIVIINASHDDLPTSYETARVFNELCAEKGWKIRSTVVNTHDELMKEVNEYPGSTLVMSQCVDKNVYNVSVAMDLESMGAVIVPGQETAPGSVFSDKDSTYRLLSNDGKNWDKVAMYKKIPVEGKSIKAVVGDMFDAVDELIEETGDDTFFVKPHEGGGGLGGFRITKAGDGYIIPDLSKVSGDISEIHPTFIDLDTSNEAKMKELLWIYRLFFSDEKMRSSYLHLDLPIEGADDAVALKILKDYLEGCAGKRREKLAKMIIDRQLAEEKLVSSLEIFEKKFQRRYIPLV
ncbi:MAG: hypothetical protein WBC16_07975, partial [Candidatus Omnitrophota bacterium]